MQQYRSAKPPQSVKGTGAFFPKSPLKDDSQTPHYRKGSKYVIISKSGQHYFFMQPPRLNSFQFSNNESFDRERKRQSSISLETRKVKGSGKADHKITDKQPAFFPKGSPKDDNQKKTYMFMQPPRLNSFQVDSMDRERKRQSSINLETRKSKGSVKNDLFNLLMRDMSKRNDSLHRDLKSTKGSTNTSFNFSYNAKKKSKREERDMSFESNIMKVYQSDSMEATGNPKAIKLLEKGKQFLKEKLILEAIDSLRKCVELEPILEGHYFLGIGYLSKGDFIDAIREFQTVIKRDPIHRKNVYLLLAITFKKLNQIHEAIGILSKVIAMFPRYYDAYIYRGKLYLKQKQVQNADQDFTSAIQLSPQKGLGYLGKADCLRLQNNFKEAIRQYQKAINCEHAVGNAAMLKKAITLYESQQYEECARDITQLIDMDPQNSEAYYFKGLCKMKLKNPVDALLCYEQAIKHNNSKKAVTKSLFEIAKIKIEQRDFYSAYHTLNRADKLDTESGYLEQFRLFTEGVIFLMKRKFTESMQNFQKMDNFNEFLKPLFYQYRAYGHFCLSEHSKALDDYRALIDLHINEPQIHYNKCLCEGIIKIEQRSYERGMECFAKAGKIFSRKMEPHLYQAVTLVAMAFKQKDTHQMIMQALQIMEQCQIINPGNANLYYLRSILRVYMNQVTEALQDIDMAIDKSEENIPKYFYFRGMVYGILKQYKAAANDFSICINLDEKFADAFLQRAKAQFLYGDTPPAFADLQQCIALLPEDPRIHVWAGNFLFANSAIDDAIKAYSNPKDYKTNVELLRLTSECYMVLGQLAKCQEEVNRIYKISKDKVSEFDKDCLAAIRIVFRDDQEIYFNEDSETEPVELMGLLNKAIQALNSLINCRIQGRLFKSFHVYIFRGVFNFHLKKYEEALRDFQMGKSQKELSIAEKRLKCKEGYEVTEDEEDADLLEILEIKFNELLCMVILKQYNKARERCKQLIDNINESKQEGLQYILYLLDELQHFEAVKVEYPRIICLYDEPKENLICFQVPIVTIHDLKVRLSFSLPKLSPPSLNIIFDKSLVQTIGPLSVENKPEAPWIKRESDDMIIFTDNVQMMDDIRLETEVEPVIVDKSQIKNNLMLDKDIEDKLKRILEKKR